jgi:hypothetical protein
MRIILKQRRCLAGVSADQRTDVAPTSQHLSTVIPEDLSPTIVPSEGTMCCCLSLTAVLLRLCLTVGLSPAILPPSSHTQHDEEKLKNIQLESLGASVPTVYKCACIMSHVT